MGDHVSAWARARRSHRAFTLLEVMVAVAILGLGLITILTAQTGLFSSAKRAARLSLAVGLARCKMSEIEEELLREGFQLTAEEEQGSCCEDEESDLRCEWSIIPVRMPELSQAGNGPDAGAEQSPTSSLDALSAAKDDMSQGDTAGAMADLSGAAPGAAESGSSMGASALAPLAMGLIYPQLKGMLEASIRKVTVRVVWSEGPIERDMSVTQYVTNPQQGGLLAEDGAMAGQAGSSGLPASGISPLGGGTR